MARQIPRLTDGRLPPYSYVPGQHPHPVSDPAGHSRAEHILPADESQVTSHWDQHCRAVDLFNHGYYWESHEVWESLWHALGRTTSSALFAKALIKLAAAGVKAREGRVPGLRRHAQRAAQLFEGCAENGLFCSEQVFGLSAALLGRQCVAIAEQAEGLIDTTACAVKPVLPLTLSPARPHPGSRR